MVKKICFEGESPKDRKEDLEGVVVNIIFTYILMYGCFMYIALFPFLVKFLLLGILALYGIFVICNKIISKMLSLIKSNEKCQ